MYTFIDWLLISFRFVRRRKKTKRERYKEAQRSEERTHHFSPGATATTSILVGNEKFESSDIPTGHTSTTSICSEVIHQSWSQVTVATKLGRFREINDVFIFKCARPCQSVVSYFFFLIWNGAKSLFFGDGKMSGTLIFFPGPSFFSAQFFFSLRRCDGRL